MYQSPIAGHRLTTTSWNGHDGDFEGTGNFGVLSTHKFGAAPEETTGEIPHVEQHGMAERKCEQSFTIGDAIGIAVQRRDAESTCTNSKLNVMSKSKDNRSIIRADDRRGQKNEGKATAMVETLDS